MNLLNVKTKSKFAVAIFFLLGLISFSALAGEPVKPAPKCTDYCHLQSGFNCILTAHYSDGTSATFTCYNMGAGPDEPAN